MRILVKDGLSSRSIKNLYLSCKLYTTKVLSISDGPTRIYIVRRVLLAFLSQSRSATREVWFETTNHVRIPVHTQILDVLNQFDFGQASHL